MQQKRFKLKLVRAFSVDWPSKLITVGHSLESKACISAKDIFNLKHIQERCVTTQKTAAEETGM